MTTITPHYFETHDIIAPTTYHEAFDIIVIQNLGKIWKEKSFRQ
jgi:hypothetical protein